MAMLQRNIATSQIGVNAISNLRTFYFKVQAHCVFGFKSKTNM